jgi:uncharacterized protein
MKREVRTFSGAEIRAKAAAGADGYAAVFNTVTDLGWFKEKIKPGAFSRAISEKQDVRCLMNHDDNMVLGRTKNSTLTLVEDSKGLKFSCDFPDTQPARDLRTLLSRGDVDSCSFGFIVRKQTWTEEKTEDGRFNETREIEDLDLFDVSIVTFPQYDNTSAEARSLWPHGVPEEVRSHKHKREKNDDCDCNCAACEDGECDECSNEDCDDAACRDAGCPMQSGRSSANAGGRESREAKTKKVDGEDLGSEAFIIVGDKDDTKTWKLPWKFSTEEKTKSHLRNALSRFNQVKGISDEVKDKAWTKLVKLCKEHDIDVSEENSKKWSLTDAQLRELTVKEAMSPEEEAEKVRLRLRLVKADL